MVWCGRVRHSVMYCGVEYGIVYYDIVQFLALYSIVWCDTVSKNNLTISYYQKYAQEYPLNKERMLPYFKVSLFAIKTLPIHPLKLWNMPLCLVYFWMNPTCLAHIVTSISPFICCPSKHLHFANRVLPPKAFAISSSGLAERPTQISQLARKCKAYGCRW